MFGSFEMGRYFLDEHVVLKAVRDGARYASRQRFTNFTCPAGTVNAGIETATRNVVLSRSSSRALRAAPATMSTR
jgi:Flp pilus assembly protein TadG